MPHLSLDDLARIQAGDGEAFRPLVERYTGMLAAVAARYANDADREDLIQAMWIRVYNKISLYDPRRGPIGSWIWAVALNVARELGRRAKRREGLSARVHDGLEDATAANSGEAALLERERDRRLYEAIARLPRLQRQAVCLRYLEGLSVAETARALGRAEGTIKASVARAIVRLRALLSEPENG